MIDPKSVEIYVHPLSPTCYQLLLSLLEEAIIEDVKVINICTDVGKAFSSGVIIVPWIEVNGEAIAAGAIDVSAAVRYIKYGRKVKQKLTAGTLVQNFVKSLTSSASLSAASLLLGDFRQFLTDRYFTALTQVKLYKYDEIDKIMKEAKDELMEKSRDIVQTNRMNFIESIAEEILRDMYLLWRDKAGEVVKNFSERELVNLIIYKASLGPATLTGCIELEKVITIAKEVKSTIAETCDTRLAVLAEQYEKIRKDEIYCYMLNLITS